MEDNINSKKINFKKDVKKLTIPKGLKDDELEKVETVEYVIIIDK